MSIFDNETTAIQELIENKKPDCVEALEKEFWQARGAGLGIREAFHKAEITHFIKDHDGLNHGEENPHSVQTDEDVRRVSEEGVAVALAEGEADAQKLADVFLSWYDLYRSWGADVYLSYTGALRVAEEIHDENTDTPELEAEAQKILDEFPIAHLKGIVTETYNAARRKGYTIRKSLEKAQEAVSVLSSISRLFGDGGLIQ